MAAANRERAELESKKNELEAKVQTASEAEAKLAKYGAEIQERDRELVRLQHVVSTQRLQLQNQLRAVALLSSPDMGLIQLRSTESGGLAQAHALVVNQSQLLFYASNLPPLAAGRVYQLWLIRKTDPAVTSGGIFTGEQTAGPVLHLSSATLLQGITALAITDEPAGGSRLPTGPKLLLGTVGRS